MYLDRVIENDQRMVESWKGDAEGMLTFVGLQATFHTSAYNLEIVDRSLLCCGRCITRFICPDYSTQPAGHHVVLSCTYLSAIIYPTEWISTPHPLKLDRPYRAIRSAYIRHLGQRALVYESRHQSVLRFISNIATAVGTSL